MDEFKSLEYVYQRHYGLQNNDNSEEAKEMRAHLSIVENNLIQNYKAAELSSKIKDVKKGIEKSCDQSIQTTADFFSTDEVRSMMFKNHQNIKRFSNATSDVT
jgi:hypothetical protein